MTANILLAHGSSDPEWAAAFDTMTARACQNIPDTHIAYMELSSPSLSDKITELHHLGFSHFHVIPLFLAKGKHLKTDIPEILQNLKKTIHIEYTLHPPIGEHPILANAIFEIARSISKT